MVSKTPKLELHILLCFSRMESLTLAKKPVDIEFPVLLELKRQSAAAVGRWPKVPVTAGHSWPSLALQNSWTWSSQQRTFGIVTNISPAYYIALDRFPMLTCENSFHIVCCARHASERRQTDATSLQHRQSATKNCCYSSRKQWKK